MCENSLSRILFSYSNFGSVLWGDSGLTLPQIEDSYRRKVTEQRGVVVFPAVPKVSIIMSHGILPVLKKTVGAAALVREKQEFIHLFDFCTLNSN